MVATILGYTPLEERHITVKTMDALECLLDERNPQQAYFKSTLAKAYKPTTAKWLKIVHSVNIAKQSGFKIVRNSRHKQSGKEKKIRDPGDFMAGERTFFSGQHIPLFSGTDNQLWGLKRVDGKEVHFSTAAVVSTDGSTRPDRPVSGAAMVAVTDDFKDNEYTPVASYWTIDRPNNHWAELSAIYKAIRCAPVSCDVIVYTDSMSSIQAIAKTLRGISLTKSLRLNARPYLRAICDTITRKLDCGSSVDIRHVYSHTGFRNLPSIANEAADHLAKYAIDNAQQDEEAESVIDLLKHDLQYIVRHIVTNESADGVLTTSTTDLHGDIREHIKRTLEAQRKTTWKARKKKGKLAFGNVGLW